MLSALFATVVVLCTICYLVDEVCSPVCCVFCGRRVCFVVCVLSILYLVLCNVLCCVVHHSALCAVYCCVWQTRWCGRSQGHTLREGEAAETTRRESCVPAWTHSRSRILTCMRHSISPTHVHTHTAIENGKTTTKIVLWQSLLPDKWNITLAGKTSILILEGDATLGRGR